MNVSDGSHNSCLGDMFPMLRERACLLPNTPLILFEVSAFTLHCTAKYNETEVLFLLANRK